MLRQINLRQWIFNFAYRYRLPRSLILSVFVAIVLILLQTSNSFANLQFTLQDTYFVSQDTSDQIVIVAVDNDSLQMYGRSLVEWDRSIYADLVSVLSEGQARVIAFDILFTEETANDAIFAQALVDARQSETRTRIVVASTGIDVPTDASDTAEYTNVLNYGNVLTPNSLILDATDYLGFVNTFPDVDSRIRRQSSVFLTNDTTVNFSFSIATYLAYLRIPSLAYSQVIQEEGNTLFVTPERELSVDDNGLWMQNYFGQPANSQSQTFPIVSLLDVVNSEVDLQLFNDKIVLVGLFDSTGATDLYPAPIGDSGTPMAGVEIQANAIESLLQDVPLKEQSNTSQIIIIIAFSLLAGVLYSFPRWYLKVVLAVVLLALWILVSTLLFHTQHIVIDLLYSGLAIALPLIVIIGDDISREIQRRQMSEFMTDSLVELSKQQLDIDRILPLIASDIDKLIPNSTGSIWLNESSESVPIQHYWGENGDAQLGTVGGEVQQVIETETEITQKTSLILPLSSNDRVLGAVSVRAKGQISYQQRQSVVDLIKRISPHIETSFLHKQVTRQNELVNRIFQNSPIGIYIINKQGIILRHNSFWETITRGRVTISKDQNIYDVLAELNVNEVQINNTREAIESSKPFHFQLDIGDNALDANGVLLSDENQWIVVLSDISNLVNLNKLRTQMIRMASHDIKNPLSRIIGYAELMMMDADQMPKNFKKYFAYITNASTEIDSIIHDILDLELLRSADVQMEELRLNELVLEIISRHEPDAQIKKQNLRFDVCEESIMIKGDYRKLGQAISNLISNAIKYTPDKGDVTVRLQRKADNGYFEVEDSGYGIPESAQSDIFTEFYRVTTKDTAHIAGTGLGLSLVKAVIETHGGDIDFTSTEGQGTTFYFTLPITTEHEG